MEVIREPKNQPHLAKLEKLTATKKTNTTRIKSFSGDKA